jgi:hypothetical protein
MSGVRNLRLRVRKQADSSGNLGPRNDKLMGSLNILGSLNVRLTLPRCLLNNIIWNSRDAVRVE